MMDVKAAQPHENHEGACVESPEGVGVNGEGAVSEAQAQPEPVQVLRTAVQPRLHFTSGDLRRSIIINEVIGKPKALRNRRK